MLASLLLPMLFALQATPAASTLSGDWKTSNDSIVRVYPCDGSHLCARVVVVGPKTKPQLDVNNPDTGLRNRPICGLTIGTGFAPDGTDTAKDGKIYDPESGKTYSAQMQSEGETLKLRGFVGISLLGRTEKWQRVSSTGAACQ